MDALTLHRIHFAFHDYLPLSVSAAHDGPGAADRGAEDDGAAEHDDERYNEAARFWAKIFAVNFLLGVVTGIPMEFQFGTNWSEFSRRTGGVIGQPLAMEGVFSFFLESAFLGLFLFGEKRLSQWAALGRGVHGVSGFVDLRILHHRDRMRGCSIRWRIGFCRTGRIEVASFWGC